MPLRGYLRSRQRTRLTIRAVGCLTDYLIGTRTSERISDLEKHGQNSLRSSDRRSCHACVKVFTETAGKRTLKSRAGSISNMCRTKRCAAPCLEPCTDAAAPSADFKNQRRKYTHHHASILRRVSSGSNSWRASDGSPVSRCA